jgi:hypothetical protein
MLMLAIVRHESVAGVQISAEYTAPLSLNSSPELLPADDDHLAGRQRHRVLERAALRHRCSVRITGVGPFRSTL